MDGCAMPMAWSASGPLGMPETVAELTMVEFGRETIGRAFGPGYAPTSPLRRLSRPAKRSAALGYASKGFVVHAATLDADR